MIDYLFQKLVERNQRLWHKLTFDKYLPLFAHATNFVYTHRLNFGVLNVKVLRKRSMIHLAVIDWLKWLDASFLFKFAQLFQVKAASISHQ